jgi:hypothetical protein
MSAQFSIDFANIGSLENTVSSGILDANNVASRAAIPRRHDRHVELIACTDELSLRK